MNKGYVIVKLFFFNSGINQVIVSENDYNEVIFLYSFIVLKVILCFIS